jgi:16S rRNA (guanine527-N7)-methyltransferase
MMTESADRLQQLILESGVALESGIARQMLGYLFLLEKWNPTVNLTSTTDWSGIGPLFQEAIWASSFYPDDAASHLDIGSGAGFPAFPLRILNPQVQMEMVESRTRRSVFLETVAAALGMHDTRIHNMRLDTFLQRSDCSKTWDCVSWKALKPGKDDLRMLREHAHPRTQFWMFHGAELAVEEPAIFGTSFKLIRSERFQGKKWFLSIYRPL